MLTDKERKLAAERAKIYPPGSGMHFFSNNEDSGGSKDAAECCKVHPEWVEEYG